MKNEKGKLQMRIFYQICAAIKSDKFFFRTAKTKLPNNIIDEKAQKEREISYISTVSQVEGINPTEFINYLAKKPYLDVKPGDYLLDISQMINFLPPKPARLLDLGVGSGWTSEIYARCGYEVVGLDISPQMIDIAKDRLSPGLNLAFHVCDFEQSIHFSPFDAVTIYDSLHHSVDEVLTLKQVYSVLKPNGIFLAMEPGKGHSQTEDTKRTVKKYGTTEKDMPFTYIKNILQDVGFKEIKQFIRLRQLALLDLSQPINRQNQKNIFQRLLYETTENGLTSLILAKK
jgi:ubiquinone/menaquinone biosynthesis C-methylase UbiE